MFLGDEIGWKNDAKTQHKSIFRRLHRRLGGKKWCLVMQYTISIDQTRAIEWGLSLPQAMLFDYLTRLSTWAKATTLGGQTFFCFRRTKLAAELPLVSESAATFKRHIKALADKELIEVRHIDTTPYLRVTEKGSEWNRVPPRAELRTPAQSCATPGAELRRDPAQNCATISTTNISSTNQEEKRGRKRHPADRKKSKNPDRPKDVPESVWTDWLDLRRRKRAPVTATVIGAARREAGKAGMDLSEFFIEWCLRGSQGLKASWLIDRGDKNGNRDDRRETLADRNERQFRMAQQLEQREAESDASRISDREAMDSHGGHLRPPLE